MMASPTARPLPKEGDRCMRRPGCRIDFHDAAALLFQRAGAWCRTPRPRRKCPGPPCVRAAMARAATSGCTSSVTSVADAAGGQIGVVAQVHALALGRHRFGAEALARQAWPWQCRRSGSWSARWRGPIRGAGRRLTESTSSCNRCARHRRPPCGGSRRAAATSLSPTTSKRKSLPGMKRSTSMSSRNSLAAR